MRWPLAVCAFFAAGSVRAERVDLPWVSAVGGRVQRAVAWQPPSSGARDAFAALASTGWQAEWDRETGVPMWLHGSHVDAKGAVGDAGIAERAARGFLAAHIRVLAPGARAEDFELVANQRDSELRTIGFRQRYRGLGVLGGQVGFVFGHDRLFAVSSSALPDVTATIGPRATDVSRAAAWVCAQTGHHATVHGVTGRAILPIVRGAGAIAYTAVDVVDVRAEFGAWDVYVASDGTPLARRSRIFYGSSTLEFNAGERYATGTRADYPAPRVPVIVDDAFSVTDDSAGFTWTGTADASVVPKAANDQVVIVNHAGANVTATLDAHDGSPLAWNLATDETGDAQLSTFTYAMRAKARDRIVNPAAAAWLDQALAFHVNENGFCNAFSTGDDVHFFLANGQCQNTGRLADVVFHEFGHSFHNHSLIPGMGMMEPHYAEGAADFNAALINEDPGVGRGFFYSDAPSRDIDPPGVEKRWPDDIDDDPHVTGLIISGALWDLRKELVAQLGHDAGTVATDRIYAGVLQRAFDIPSTYMAALIADDDNGDLGDGTPNHCAIDHAFTIHGLANAPTTMIDPPAVSVGDGLAISLAAHTPTGVACPPPTVSTVTVTWQVHGGAPSTFTLTPDGDTWHGSFPAQPDGTLLEYKVEAALSDGSTRVFPDNRADPLYQLYLGPVTQLLCEPFDTDPHWIQAGQHGNQWEVAAPQGLGGDPAAAFDGTMALGTDLTGDGRYPANDHSVIDLPPVDVSRFAAVHLQYRRWLTVEDARFDLATILVNTHEAWRNASSLAGLDHVDKEWRFHDVDLSPYVAATGTAQVRFSLSSDTIKQLGGWTVDDVCIVGIGSTARCGDGIIDPPEQCDDGNALAGDGCSNTCQEEITAGGGGGCSTGSQPAGLLPVGLVLVALRRRSRHVLRPS